MWLRPRSRSPAARASPTDPGCARDRRTNHHSEGSPMLVQGDPSARTSGGHHDGPTIEPGGLHSLFNRRKRTGMTLVATRMQFHPGAAVRGLKSGGSGAVPERHRPGGEQNVVATSTGLGHEKVERFARWGRSCLLVHAPPYQHVRQVVATMLTLRHPQPAMISTTWAPRQKVHRAESAAETSGMAPSPACAASGGRGAASRRGWPCFSGCHDRI
jgi:hypothetical protein